MKIEEAREYLKKCQYDHYAKAREQKPNSGAERYHMGRADAFDHAADIVAGIMITVEGSK